MDSRPKSSSFNDSELQAETFNSVWHIHNSDRNPQLSEVLGAAQLEQAIVDSTPPVEPILKEMIPANRLQDCQFLTYK